MKLNKIWKYYLSIYVLLTDQICSLTKKQVFRFGLYNIDHLVFLIIKIVDSIHSGREKKN